MNASPADEEDEGDPDYGATHGKDPKYATWVPPAGQTGDGVRGGCRGGGGECGIHVVGCCSGQGGGGLREPGRIRRLCITMAAAMANSSPTSL